MFWMVMTATTWLAFVHEFLYGTSILVHDILQ